MTEEQIRENGVNRSEYQNAITQFFHNDKINTINNIFNNWTKHLSFDYLYFHGGEPMRLQVPQTGIFLFVEFIFLLSGMLLMFRHGKFKLLFLSLLVILIGFLPAGLTFEEVPSTHRPIFASIGFFILEGYFLFYLSKRIFEKKMKVTAVILILILAYQISVYLHNYLILSPRHKNWWRHGEMYELSFFMKRNINKYNHIYIVKNSVEPAYFYYFFNNLDPLPVILNKTKTMSGTWGEGKITFVHDSCVPRDLIKEDNVLIIERIECLGSGTLIRDVSSSDGTKILKILKP